MNKSNNKWLSVIVAFSFCLPLFAFTSGDGTYENPYEIAGASDIVNLIDMVATNDCSGVYFLQTADIDLTSFGNFQGIGSVSADLATTNAFSGFYDGDGYWISNMFVNLTNEGAGAIERGFFNHIVGATLANINVQGSITGSITATAQKFRVGGVVGTGKGGCILEGIVSNVKQGWYMAALTTVRFALLGGVACRVYNTGSITWTDIKNYGDIVIGGPFAGGLIVVGCFAETGSGTFKDIENHGNLIVPCQNKYNFQYGSSYAPLIVGVIGSSPSKGRTIKGAYNYGDIVMREGGCCYGVLSAGGGGGVYYYNYDCVNHGDIYFTASIGGAKDVYIDGVVGDKGYYIVNQGMTNYGNIRIDIEATAGMYFDIGGVSGSHANYSQNDFEKNFVNYGDIDISVSKGWSQKWFFAVGGISCTLNDASYVRGNNWYNYGNIRFTANTADFSLSEFGIAGVTSPSPITITTEGDLRGGDFVNFGTIEVNVATNFTGLADVSGILSEKSTRKSDSIVSNAYNLGTIKWTGKNLHIGGLMGMAECKTNSNEYISFHNSYSCGQMIGETNGNYVGSLIGRMNGDLGAVNLSNCFAIANNVKAIGKIEGTMSYTNNVGSYTYDEFYRNPSVSGNYLYHYAFTNGGRDTNSYYDLALPINKLLFPTITEEVKQKHNWTRLNGYKRYIRTITNNQ